MDIRCDSSLKTPTVEGLASSVELMLGREWLAGVWAELLGRDNIQLDDNFFSLGGKPELLVFVQLRIAAEFGRQISIDQLIENATLRQQSELTRGPWEAPPCSLPGYSPFNQKVRETGSTGYIIWASAWPR